MNTYREKSDPWRSSLVVWGSAALLLFMMLAAAFLVFLWADYPPVSISRLEQLQPSMSPSQVRGVLGEPSGIWSDNLWAHSSKYVSPHLDVYFDEDGKFTGYHIDH